MSGKFKQKGSITYLQHLPVGEIFEARGEKFQVILGGSCGKCAFGSDHVDLLKPENRWICLDSKHAFKSERKTYRPHCMSDRRADGEGVSFIRVEE